MWNLGGIRRASALQDARNARSIVRRVGVDVEGVREANEEIEERPIVDRFRNLGIVQPAARNPWTCSSVMR